MLGELARSPEFLPENKSLIFSLTFGSLAPTIMEETQSNSSTWSDDRSQKTAESLRALRDQAGQTLDDHRQCVSDVETQLSNQLQHIADEIANEKLVDQEAAAFTSKQTKALEEVQQSLTEKEAEVLDVLEQLASQSLAIETQLLERDEELEQLLELGEAENLERKAIQQELQVALQTIEQSETEECTSCAQASEELATATEQLEQLKQQLHSLQKEHEQQQAELELAEKNSQTVQALNEQATASLVESEGSAAEADDLIAESTELLEAAEARVAKAEEQVARIEKTMADAEKRIVELEQQQKNFQQNSEELNEEVDQTRRKFELALEDVNKLKRENSELQEDLLSRPEASDQASPELVSLRVERDALADRVLELEAAPAPEVDEDAQQVLEDLQSRFELAVDDVRQLKQEKAKLQQKLETAGEAPTTIINDGPLDWQAQKAQLLASLEAEDDDVIDESRREERAAIKTTILNTDRVIAEKEALLAKRDSEIVELRTQLEERPAGENLETLREQITEEILGDDDAIKHARETLQERQQQLDDTLREAELKISIDRATLARDQAELKEKLAEIANQEPDEQENNGEKPRRRWLSALGLKEDKDDAENAG